MRSTKTVGLAVAQHFLLSPAAKTLSIASVARLSDEEAFESFRQIRWADTKGDLWVAYSDAYLVVKLAVYWGDY